MTTNNLTYEPGTRYSNSETYDEATTEVVHGWQVFIQKRADGTPTGRKSFVDHKGCLCGIDIAELRRKDAKAAAVEELLEIAEWAHAAFGYLAIKGGTDKERTTEMIRRRDVAWATLHKARGLAS